MGAVGGAWRGQWAGSFSRALDVLLHEHAGVLARARAVGGLGAGLGWGSPLGVSWAGTAAGVDDGWAGAGVDDGNDDGNDCNDSPLCFFISPLCFYISHYVFIFPLAMRWRFFSSLFRFAVEIARISPR